MYNVYGVVNLKYNVKLVQRKQLLSDYYEFDFEKPEDFHFQEGQYGTFEMIHKEIDDRKFRVFSFASTDDEPMIKIATKIPNPATIYKQNLMTMELGEEMTMNAPIGKFTLETDKPAVFIAGGIGITPIRSILMSKEAKKSDRQDLLIYSELEKYYPYQEDLESLKHLKIVYVSDVIPTQNAIVAAASSNQNDAWYYISGSPVFVKEISKLLESIGIESSQIKFDVFTGY